MFDLGLMNFNPGAPSFLVMLITAFFAFFLSSIIAITYEFTTKSIYRKSHFLQSLALISIAASTILQAIGESVAIGLGILGALSIIRFRTTFTDPRNISFMFASLGAGIATGVMGYGIAMTGTLVFCIGAILLRFSPWANNNELIGQLKLRMPREGHLQEIIEDRLKAFCTDFELDRLKFFTSKKGSAKNQGMPPADEVAATTDAMEPAEPVEPAPIPVPIPVVPENLQVMEDMMAVLADKQTIYERMLGTYQVELEKLMSLQTQQSDFEISFNKLKLERDYLLNKYQLQGVELDFSNFVGVEEVSQFLANNILSTDIDGLVDQETEFEKQLLIREIELETSENRQLIDFVQVKYNGPHTDFLRERLSVGLGFQLSNAGDKRLKMQELQIEQEELNRETERDIREDQAKLTDLELKLRSDIQAFFHLQEVMQKERAQLQRLGNDMSQKEGVSPLILLDIEERHYTMKLESLEEMEDLLADYLTYLEESNKMCGPGVVNYLSQ